MRKLSVIARKPGLALAAFTILILAAVAFADDDSSFKVVPFTFDPFNTDLVASRWVNGAGCPTGATEVKLDVNGNPLSPSTFTDPACDPAVGGGDPKDKENEGLLLVKTGDTPNDAAAGARIKGVKGIMLTELGYDIRSGSHCGAGAPRFNVQASDGFHFIGGCSNGTVIVSTSTGWKRVRFSPTNPAESF